MKRIAWFCLAAALFLAVSSPAYPQLWAIRGVTRVYFGRGTDQPVPADYSGGGTAGIAIFRWFGTSTGLWAVRGLSRIYFGQAFDRGVPGDYTGNGTADPTIFRSDNGLWAVRGGVRTYFGNALDTVVPADYNGDRKSDIAIFRPAAGLWAIRGITRAYFGAAGDIPAPADYTGNGSEEMAVFRPASGLWAIRGVTRRYFGRDGDIPIPGDYGGDGTAELAVFRPASGLWAIRGVTRAYFGAAGDQPVPRDYTGNGRLGIALFRHITTPIPSPPPTASPIPTSSPTPLGYKTPIPTPSPTGQIYRIKYGGETGAVTVNGIVSLVYPNMSFYLSEKAAPYCGIYVYQSTYGPDIGDDVTVSGSVTTYKGKKQVSSVSAYQVNSKDNPVFPPVTVGLGSVLDPAYEGILVRIENVAVTNQHSGYGRWVVATGSNSVTVDDELDYNYFPHNGDIFHSITGIVERNTDNSPPQWLQPRFTADLDAPPEILPHYALKGTVVTMDDYHNVYDNYYLEVKGDLIESLSSSAPEGVDIIDVDGLIFPGLISTHDHLDYGMWDFIPFTLPPYFVGRNEWAASQMYCDFKSQFNRAKNVDPPHISNKTKKLVEVRMASSGCTVTQSQTQSWQHSQDAWAKLGVGIVNGERFPGRCKLKVVGTTSSASEWATAHQNGVNGKIHRYIVHLAETTDRGGNMMGQWNWWKANAGFDGRDTIIHGVNIPAGEYALFNHGFDQFGKPLHTVLSWAAKSNMLLYDETADILGALAQGVKVALAPDWTESGMPNMLAELNYCKAVADAKGWNIQTRLFIDMVTRNAAEGFGQLWRMGTIEEGKLASLMVIDDGPGDPYDDLMMVAGGGADEDYRCGPGDVRLTVVAGRPIYGDGDLLNDTNFPFLWSGYIEDLTICGQVKQLSIARFNNGGYTGVDELFGDFYRDLWDASQAVGAYPCSFLSVDPADTIPFP